MEATSLQEFESLLGSRDSIMEPTIFGTLKHFLQSGGDPEKAVDLLIGNYHAVAQTANLLAEWLIMSGMEINEVCMIRTRRLLQLPVLCILR